MCFPSKWLKKNFADEERPATAATPRPAGDTDKPTTNGTTVTAKDTPKSFKTAIVIYTMYGHIASRELTWIMIAMSPITMVDFILTLAFNSCRICQDRFRIRGWKCDNLPVSCHQSFRLNPHPILQGPRNPPRGRPAEDACSPKAQLPNHHPRYPCHLRLFPPWHPN